MLTVDTVFKFFEYFYRKKYILTNYKMSVTKKDEQHITSFLLLLQEQYKQTVSGDFLFTYFTFQFTYWEQVNLEKVSNIKLPFIVGKKAFERFLKRNTEFDWTIEQSPFLAKYKIFKTDLIKAESKKNWTVVKGNIDTEANFKLAAYNTPEGFINCLDFSTLFNHKSHICQGCIYKDSCKIKLLEFFPQLYKDRGY